MTVRATCPSGELHYSDVTMSVMASKITCVTSVCSTVCSGADQRKHQSSASLAFVRGIHRSPMDSPHKVPLTLKMVPYDDVILTCAYSTASKCNHIWMVSCQKGPTRHTYAWQLGPFWQHTLDLSTKHHSPWYIQTLHTWFPIVCTYSWYIVCGTASDFHTFDMKRPQNSSTNTYLSKTNLI